jgi:hypothetical protein
MKLAFKYSFIVLFFITFYACDLPLQKSFHFDKSAHLPKIPPYKTTIWTYMTHPEDSTFDQNEHLDSMVIAVKRAELKNIYNKGKNKTVFLLRNKAMREFLANNGYKSISEVPVYILQNLLKYHVIPDTSIEQIDLPIKEYRQFQTLIKGANGLMNLYEGKEYWQIRINTNGPLPPTAKKAVVYLHNFEFTNGVAHQLNSYARWVPFSSIHENK